jgi:zinc protease
MTGWLRCLVLLVAVAFAVSPAHALKIESVKSPGGIEAWLVEDKTIPLIAMMFAFGPAAAADPPGKEGLATFLTGMMDEGAGDLDSAAFQAKRDELAFKMSFDAGLDYFEGSFQTLSRNRDQSFALLKLALQQPRFDAEPLERVRGQFIVAARQNLEDPDKIASRAWMRTAFPEHVYGRGSDGTPESIAAITAEDLRGLAKKLFTRRTLKVSVVGDIDAESLKRLLDDTFGGLPDSEPPLAIPRPPMPKGPQVNVIDRDIPQSIIVFGGDGPLRDDPDFIPAFVMSNILGGGGFGSRLTNEIREKRGLTYGISAGIYPLEHAGMFLGQVGTRNDKAAEVLDLVRATIKRFAEEGPTAEELNDAKTYLTGSYALRFDSNRKIADQLLGIQTQGVGIDYIDKRNALIEAVTLEQVKAQARRLLHPDKMLVTIVGRPQGVTKTGG